jgi:hypothetical protein
MSEVHFTDGKWIGTNRVKECRLADACVAQAQSRLVVIWAVYNSYISFRVGVAYNRS